MRRFGLVDLLSARVQPDDTIKIARQAERELSASATNIERRMPFRDH